MAHVVALNKLWASIHPTIGNRIDMVANSPTPSCQAIRKASGPRGWLNHRWTAVTLPVKKTKIPKWTITEERCLKCLTAYRHNISFAKASKWYYEWRIDDDGRIARQPVTYTPDCMLCPETEALMKSGEL
jgi:hypothetical protein